MAIRFLDEEQKPKIRFLDEEPIRKTPEISPLEERPERERILPQKSPISLLERAQLSFANPEGARKFLTNRFPGSKIEQLPTGKFTVDGNPIDPAGFRISDIPGDIADVASEAVRLGGQIKGAATGAALGAPAGPIGVGAGTIVGGIAGRATGQLSVEAIGRALGLRDDELIDVVKDIGKEAVIGGVTEAGGLALRAVSKPAAKLVKRIFERIQKKVTRPTLQNLFNFTAGIGKESINRVQTKGASKILTRQNMSEESVLRVARKVQNGMRNLRIAAGKQVGKGKEALQISGKNIRIHDLRKSFDRELQKAGLLDDAFQVVPPLQIGTQTGQELIDIRNVLRGFKGKNVSIKDAFRLKDKLDDLVKFAKEGKLQVGTNEERIIKRLSGSIGKRTKALSKTLTEAEKKFSDIASLEEVLAPKLNLATSAEPTIKNFLKGKAFIKEKLIEVDKLLPKKQKFVEELLDVIAARDFASGTFRGIRTGIFSSILGSLGLVGGGPSGAIKGLVTGVAVSTPRTVGRLLQGQQLLGKGIEKGILGAGRVAGRLLPRAGAGEISRRERIKDINLRQ